MTKWIILGLVFGMIVVGKVSAEEEPGLVGYWSFDEGKGETAKDYSENGNHGKILGAEWVEGIKGYALEFDGIDDYVDCGQDESLNITDEITIEVWVKPIFFNTTDYQFIGFVWKADNNDHYQNTQYALTKNYKKADNFMFFGSFGSRTADIWSASSKAYLKIGIWQHLAATYDFLTHTTRLYYNGELNKETTTAIIGALKPCPTPVIIGRRQNWYFNGLIDEVRIYNRALSEDEIKKHYEGTRGPML